MRGDENDSWGKHHPTWPPYDPHKSAEGGFDRQTDRGRWHLNLAMTEIISFCMDSSEGVGSLELVMLVTKHRKHIILQTDHMTHW